MFEEAQLSSIPVDRSRSAALCTRQVAKPWGRIELPPPFANETGQRIGEIWFEHPDCDLPLLVKYIFTSEKLSVQVHPDDEQARQRGLSNGKTECWYVLDAEPDARLGLGLAKPMTPNEIRSAAVDGSIEQLMNWIPVRPGDFVYVPAGTIHAIGAGIGLLEFQQNADVTYRLFDYGRPRELHLDEAAGVSRPDFDIGRHFKRTGPADGLLVDSPHFSLVRASSTDALPDSLSKRRKWIMPLAGSASAGGVTVQAGGCLLASAMDELTFSPSSAILVGVEGSIQNS